MKALISKLDKDKIEINWNKNPIKMELFLSFLTIETEINKDYLGYNNGWTFKVNKEHNLYIKGGYVGRIEYLNNIKYGKNLDNPYNNYVNPFYLFPIMNKEGRKFFFEYYKNDIEELIMRQEQEIQHAKSKFQELENAFNEIIEQSL